MTTTFPRKSSSSNSVDIPVIVLVGPTASGKTALSIHLAKKYGGEVISADSRQVFKGLDIGTGKVTLAETEGIPHYCIDIVAPTETYSANRFIEDAGTAIEAIHAKGKIPIVAGGTGFYIDALFGRITLGSAPANHALRDELETKSTEELFLILADRNPVRAAAIQTKHEEKNRVRLIRAIEIASSELPAAVPQERNTQYVPLWIGVTHPRDTLRERINYRLRERIQAGMFDEMRRLHEGGLSYERMHALGLEYRYGALVLQGTLSEAGAETTLQQKIWQYARRQTAYWKRNTEIKWFSPADIDTIHDSISTLLQKEQR
jgi:tRNA dimethylallyltransferase